MKNLYRILVPNFVRLAIWEKRKTLILGNEFQRDKTRYLKYSGFNREDRDINSRLSRLMIEYHRLEKGLTLPCPRPGFGKQSALQLLDDLNAVVDLKDAGFIANDALATLAEYIEFQRSSGILEPELEQTYRRVLSRYGQGGQTQATSGTEAVNRQEILRSVSIDYGAFVGSRHSIRNFSDKPVDLSRIEQAVRWAQTAPSVCNRQTARVWVITRKDTVSKVVELQKGCRGFGEDIDKMIVITADLKRFVTVGERNQGWVDGGIFLMSLLLALHASGLGACPLNWCVEMDTDEDLRHLLGIPEEQSVIGLIAVGNLPDRLKVAKASRVPLEHILTFI